MPNFLFDKEMIANQISVLNNTLINQRQTKKTLLSYLEKFSNAMYDNFNSESTDLLLALINEAHSVFESIKSNISKILELKKFLLNIYQSDSFDTIDSEKFNTEFNNLLEEISKTNSSYLTFMNDYENLINQNITQKTSEISPSETELSTTDSKVTLENETITTDSKVSLENATTSITEEPSLFENPDSENKILSDSQSEPKEEFSETQLEPKEENVSEPLFEPEENLVDESYFSTYLQEKVLIINKKSGIAILPYYISDLDELFLDNPEKYSSIQDIIDQEYTVSLDEYQNTSISRYKEAFKLAKDKSNYTFSQAANFAKNLLIESKVSTLIIAACRNINELEYYIECLNNDQLDLFNGFKIIEQ